MVMIFLADWNLIKQSCEKFLVCLSVLNFIGYSQCNTIIYVFWYNIYNIYYIKEIEYIKEYF